MNALTSNMAAFRKAVAEQRRLATDHRPSAESAFLPAALEVVERPVSPVGRRAMWVLLGGLVITAGWLTFGHVDIVATAMGRIIPTDDVKLVQAADAGIVRRIWVHDGDIVRRGQPLVELDPTVTTADEAQAGKALLAAQIEMARQQTIVDGLSGRTAIFKAPAGTPADVAETQRRLVAAQLSTVDAEAAGLASARRSSLLDAQAAGAQAQAYDRMSPMLDKELDAMNELDAKGYAPGLKLLELQRQRKQEVGQRDVAAAQQARGVSDARKLGQQMSQVHDQALQTALTDLAHAQSDAMMRSEDLRKAQHRSSVQRLVSPVDGTVQQLAIHTVGGVVQAVRPLMVIVPKGSLVVEAHVVNRDAGFVEAGQKVAVKLEAYPYTRYGSVPGHIVSVSSDSIEDGYKDAYYVARIALDAVTITVDGKAVPLRPGLSATGDIRLGSRRIIDYLISPVTTKVTEAAREH